MSAAAPNAYIGEIVPSIYGHCHQSPTGYGLPGYEPGRFSVEAPKPALADEAWCEEAGCPARECVHCKSTTTKEN